jgi:hypothetical protein
MTVRTRFQQDDTLAINAVAVQRIFLLHSIQKTFRAQKLIGTIRGFRSPGAGSCDNNARCTLPLKQRNASQASDWRGGTRSLQGRNSGDVQRDREK